MKATGVVRRIDELGRIVIPKEIRKNLRIKDGTNLEIFIDNNNIVLSKFSEIKELGDIASKLVETISSVYNKDIYITDNDSVIACNKKDDIGTLISDKVEKNIKERKNFISDDYAISVINKNGDALGSVIIYGTNLNDKDLHMTTFIAKFLEKYLED